MSEREARPAPDPERVLDAAKLLAEAHGIDAPREEFLARIDYVLLGRKQGWLGLASGEFGEAELRDLLIAHFDYECADRSGRSWEQLDEAQRQAVIAAIDRALYGRPAQS